MTVDFQPTSEVIYSVDSGVATLTFNRPEKLNALTPDMMADFFGYVDQAAADPSVRVIVITGAGRGFSAGLDLAVIGTGTSGNSQRKSNLHQTRQCGDDVGHKLQRFFSKGWNTEQHLVGVLFLRCTVIFVLLVSLLYLTPPLPGSVFQQKKALVGYCRA